VNVFFYKNLPVLVVQGLASGDTAAFFDAEIFGVNYHVVRRLELTPEPEMPCNKTALPGMWPDGDDWATCYGALKSKSITPDLGPHILVVKSANSFTRPGVNSG
jgi:hypothetical protein